MFCLKLSLCRSNVILAAAGILAAVPAATAQTYRIRELPPENTTGNSFGIGINEAGVVVGQGGAVGGGARAMLWDGGAPVNLGALPGFTTSLAAGISDDNNRVVGRSGTPCGTSDPTLWQAGQILPLPDVPRVHTEIRYLNGDIAVGDAYNFCGPGGSSMACRWERDPQADTWLVSTLPALAGDLDAAAACVNAVGDIVGFSGVFGLALRAVRWDNGVPGLLPDLGGGHSWAFGINDLAQIVGYSQTAGGEYHAYLIETDGTTTVDLGTLPGYAQSAATRVNNAGTVIGLVCNCTDPLVPYGVPNDNARAVIWQDGQMRRASDVVTTTSDWNSLNGLLDINERGQIVGYGYKNERYRAFLLTPECLFHGDLNDDRTISLDDLSLLLSDYGCTGFVCPGDITDDGRVDLSDLALLLSAYGTTCP
jgi:probable HAF family extracellular repeat protein